MMRLMMLFLCLLLAAAAAGRYRAEAGVKEKRDAIRSLELQKTGELRQIKMLRMEIAHLERPDRLTRIARQVTDLAPVAGDQLMTAQDFALALGGEEGAPGMGVAPAREPPYADETPAISPRAGRRALALAEASAGG